MKYKNKVDDIITIGKNLNIPDGFLIPFSNVDFSYWSGAGHSNQHHYGDGGLQYHTWQVINIALDNLRNLSKLDMLSESKIEDDTLREQIVYLAALYHDYGKLWDYVKVADTWTNAEHKYKFHHISRSAIEFSKICESVKRDSPSDMSSFVSNIIESEVVHCILSHHGERDWGSPVRPRTLEAWIVHFADGISARTTDLGLYKTHGAK